MKKIKCRQNISEHSSEYSSEYLSEYSSEYSSEHMTSSITDELLVDMIVNARKIRREEPPSSTNKANLKSTRLDAVLAQHAKDVRANLDIQRNIDEYAEHVGEVLAASLRDFAKKVKLD